MSDAFVLMNASLVLTNGVFDRRRVSCETSGFDAFVCTSDAFVLMNASLVRTNASVVRMNDALVRTKTERRVRDTEFRDSGFRYSEFRDTELGRAAGCLLLSTIIVVGPIRPMKKAARLSGLFCFYSLFLGRKYVLCAN
jgi:hypothetical protein